MAFSMLLRRPGSVLMQQAMKLATQPAVRPATQNTLQSLKSTLLKTETAPILNSVRCFRTSAIRFAEGKSQDHSKLWVIERVTSATLIPLIPLALIAPSKILDSALAIIMVAHSFWGLEAIAVDYVRASIFGPVIPKIAIGLVYLISIATLGGLFYVITHDIGIANTVRQFWSIKAGQKA
ncbi:succinate dehydrogenase [ubiquinone] cytochrome b small subunit, mitochondrial-like isoform X2 [Maniola hyperantus]|uniref:succinate dehydrogenase [ubiquinone] cytochrome b small subunit, mitochondrial-like isoform X2 n=1 Tax=Aphantopus hyperantus TaxID=2795564 RepID=UPI001568E69F|nr:succinate dehydrogenase [ubiquinone] cytochrome b small subunit, mitochondrial isoform X2 [Maniola hyperantus]